MSTEITRIAGQNFYGDELYHHGVKGMKWYQHLFGKKGSSSSGGKTARKKKKKTTLDDAIRKMSDEDLKKAANRTGDAVRLKENYAKLHSPKVSTQIKDAVVSAVTTSIKNAGQQYLEKKLKEMMGLKPEKSELETLKEESQKVTYKKIIESYNENKKAGEAAANAYRDEKVKDFMNSSVNSYKRNAPLALPGPNDNTHHRYPN